MRTFYYEFETTSMVDDVRDEIYSDYEEYEFYADYDMVFDASVNILVGQYGVTVEQAQKLVRDFNLDECLEDELKEVFKEDARSEWNEI